MNSPGGDLLPQRVAHWLSLLEPVGGQLCLLLNAGWGESKRGQDLTTRAPGVRWQLKMSGRIQWFEGTEQDAGDSTQHIHAWLIWDWNRDVSGMSFDLSAGDPRLKKGCAVCGVLLDHLRAGTKTCSARCRAALSRRRIRLASA